MFLEAVKNRIVIFPNKKAHETIDEMPPLTVEEIQKALAIHLRKDCNKQKEVYKPYYDVWLLFLQEIGDKNLIKDFLQKEPLHPIYDQNDLLHLSQGNFNFNKTFNAFNTYKSCENLSKSNMNMTIKPLKTKCFVAPYRAEANIIINNTENIQEIFVDREVEEKPKSSDYFAKTINGQFVDSGPKPTNEHKSITFYTQKYYNESLRLSKKPDLYQKTEKNPILTYVPENFDFKINKDNNQEKEKEKNFFNKKSSILSAVT